MVTDKTTANKSAKRDPISYTIKATDASVKKYIKGKENPSIIMNHLSKFLKLMRGSNVLDLGCGHGRDCRFFEDHNLRVVGVDLSENMLDEAKKVCKKSVLLKMDIRNVDKVPWKFNGIWSCAVIHHVPKEHIDKLLQSIYNILEPNGLLFLSFKIDSYGYVYREELGVDKFYELYDREDFLKKLRHTGFSILETSVEQKKYLWFNIFALKRGGGEMNES